MPIEQIQALTDDEIRVRVAELCGWWDIKPCPVLDGEIVGRFGGSASKRVPNYPADLNACREAWQPLSYTDKLAFGSALRRIVEKSGGDDPTWLEGATPRQWCDAFMAVMGKEAP